MMQHTTAERVRKTLPRDKAAIGGLARISFPDDCLYTKYPPLEIIFFQRASNVASRREYIDHSDKVTKVTRASRARVAG